MDIKRDATELLKISGSSGHPPAPALRIVLGRVGLPDQLNIRLLYDGLISRAVFALLAVI